VIRLDFMLLADAAEPGATGKLGLIGGGITRLAPPVLPSLHPSITLVMKFSADASDVGVERTFRLEIQGPSSPEPFAVHEFTVSPNPPLSPAPEEEIGTVVITQIAPLVLNDAGAIRFVLSDEAGEPVRELALVVLPPVAD
jgi:hypothetical protein